MSVSWTRSLGAREARESHRPWGRESIPITAELSARSEGFRELAALDEARSGIMREARLLQLRLHLRLEAGVVHVLHDFVVEHRLAQLFALLGGGFARRDRILRHGKEHAGGLIEKRSEKPGDHQRQRDDVAGEFELKPRVEKEV